MKSGTPRAFPIAIILTLIVSLLPRPWLEWLSWTKDVANVALMPMRHGVGKLVDLVFPAHSTPEELRELAEKQDLYDQMEQWRRHYRHAELRIRELEDRLEQIQQLPVERFSTRIRPVRADVTALNMKSPRREMELNRGLREGVRGAPGGTIAVVDGVHMVGRVTDVWTVRCVLEPVTFGTGLIEARVIPNDQPNLPMADAPRIQLEPKGDGTLIGDTSRDDAIARDDLVLLDDRSWPSIAQAMVLGTVKSVAPKDEQPIHNTVIVQPRYVLHQISGVWLLVEPTEEPDTTREGGAP